MPRAEMEDTQTSTDRTVHIDFSLPEGGVVSTAGSSPGPKDNVDPAALLQNSSEGILLFDRNGGILEANPQVLPFFLYDPAEIRNGGIAQLFANLDPALLAWIAGLAQQGRRVLLDLTCLRKDKTSLPAQAAVHAVRWGTPPEDCLCFCLRNRAARPLSTEANKPPDPRLALTERLAVAGTVAGQIAHDFNNLLTPLVAYPQMIRNDLPAGSPSIEFLDMMEKTALDMSQLTQQLLLLSRRRQPAQEVFNLREIIDQVGNWLRPTLPAGVQFVVETPDSPLRVNGNKAQVLRAMQSLCQNALEAMNGQGVLRIQTEAVYLDTPIGHYDAVNIGEYAKIGIADTGAGIPLEIRDKIFDPFFTTKKANKKRGSGLSLSIVHGMVMDHRGYIDFESEAGKGTTFYLFLPTCHEPGAASTAPAAPTPPAHKESVLVVDDDPLQITVLTGFLQSLGYTATGVQSGAEAVTLIRDRKQRFHLVILDMFMDPMDGLGTFLAIRKICPTQKTMLMSGFDRAAKRVTLAQRLGAGQYLQKPIALDKLQAALQAELRADAVPVSAAERPPIRILVTDDDRLIRKLFLMIISSELPQAVIDQASDGEEAVRLYKANPYELLVMDLQMPGKGGIEAFQEIAQICRSQNRAEPPVIFCTGFAPPSALDEIIGDGTKHTLLRKPVRVEDLTRVVRDSL